jgi:hypothetical protein
MTMSVKIIFIVFLFVSKPNDSLYSMNLKKTNDVMNDTSKILQRLERNLQAFCKPVADKFEKGLNGNYIEDVFAKLNINNNELRKLYQWRNGIKVDTGKYVGEFDFCSQGKMLPLEEAINHYTAYLKDSLWRKGCFPLFTTNAGDYLLYDIDESSSTYGMLLLYSPSLLIVEPETAYDSLENFFETVIACYNQGIYKFNETSNTLEIDQDKEFEVSSKMNLHSEYWKK